jgi:hypothetical protein
MIMKHLLVFTTAIVLPLLLAAPMPVQGATAKPNPFTLYDKKIGKIEADIAKCDATTQEKKIAKLKKDLLKEREKKDKKLRLLLRPFEEKAEKLTMEKEKAFEKRQPTAKFDKQIKKLNDKIEEIESLSKAWRRKKEAEEKTPEDAGDAGRKALKGLM